MGNFFGITIVRPLGLILMAIWSLVQNYGLALILFTLIVKLILLPFMYKQKKGMKKMNLGRRNPLQSRSAMRATEKK